jgi:hypothetical protein
MFTFCARRLSENRSLLRKSGFWPIFPIKFVKYNQYSPHLIEKMDSKPLSLATASILGQPPSEKNCPALDNSGALKCAIRDISSPIDCLGSPQLWRLTIPRAVVGDNRSIVTIKV